MPGPNRRRGQGRACRTSGMLESVLLLLVHQEPAHGYTLLEGLGEFGLEAMDPSVVYRALREMEEKGWVTSIWDEEQSLGPPRRVYRITDAGDEVLAAWIRDLDATRKMLARLVDTYRAHMKVCEGEHYPRAGGGEIEAES
ncbi:MAG: helix-turn-helix transcriptional regulator [Thermoflexales bacterium]|nr:helix-turn-helix transcriptional regulator [Thermoflexales bacterium]